MTGGVDGREHPAQRSAMEEAGRLFEWCEQHDVRPTTGDLRAVAGFFQAEIDALLVRVETAEAALAEWQRVAEERWRRIMAVERERDVLAQSMWEARRIHGFDNDGDAGPGAVITGIGIEGFARMHEREAAQARQDYDDLADEAEGWEHSAREAVRERDEARAALARVQALCDDVGCGDIYDDHAPVLAAVQAAITTPTERETTP